MKNTLEGVSEIEISYKPAIGSKPEVTSSSDAYLILKIHYPENQIALKEYFVVMYLNQANRVIGVQKLSIGGLTSAVADVRLLFGTALKISATGIVISHNHPSGNTKPSLQDRNLTKQVKEAGKLLDIKLLDHLIITPDDHYISMADNGDL
jgi:DNA repair protein RadC